MLALRLIPAELRPNQDQIAGLYVFKYKFMIK